MRANRKQLTIAFGILLLSAVECYQVYARLPDPMASNFGGDGAPGGWSSKTSFMTIHGVALAFWMSALLAVPLLARRSSQKLGAEHGLWLRDTSGWFLIASMAFSAAVTHLVFEANLVTGRLSGSFVWLVAVYVSYMIWWTVRLIRRVRRAERAARSLSR